MTRLYGAEQASISVEEWLEEVQEMDSPPPPAGANWRAVTIAASVRLAKRLDGARRHTQAGKTD